MQQKVLFDRVRQGQLEAIYLLYGPEEYLKDQAVARIKRLALGGGPEELNFASLDGKGLGAGDLVAACETLPLMSPKKLVLVRDHPALMPGAKGPEADELAYLEHPNPDAVLIFLCRGEIDKRKKLSQRLIKGEGAVYFDHLPPFDMAKWAVAQCSRAGLTLSAGEANTLVGYVGRRMEDLVRELDKLVNYCAGRARITRQDIDAVVTRNLEYNVFTLVEHLLKGEVEAAMDLLRRLRRDGQPFPAMMGALERNYRQLLLCTLYLQQGLDARQIAGRLSVPSGIGRKIVEQAKRFDRRKLEDSLRILAEADAAIKQGQLRETLAADSVMIRLALSAGGAG